MLEEITSTEMENKMLEHFGDNFLGEAMRIIGERLYTERDEALVHEAICIVTALYLKRLENGDIKKEVLH